MPQDITLTPSAEGEKAIEKNTGLSADAAAQAEFARVQQRNIEQALRNAFKTLSIADQRTALAAVGADPLV